MINEKIYKCRMSDVPTHFFDVAGASKFIGEYDFAWMDIDDINKFKKNAEDFISFHKDREKYEKLLNALTSIVCHGAITDKVDVSEEFYEPLIELESKIVIANNEISNNRYEIEVLQNKLKEEKNMVDRQLKLIASAIRGDIEEFMGMEYPEEVFNSINIERLRTAVSCISSSS